MLRAMALLRRRAGATPRARSPASRTRLVVLGFAVAAALGGAWWLRGGAGPAPQPLTTDMAMVLQVRDRILRAGLTHDGADCLAFRILPEVSGQPTRLDVLEKHNARCGGDPGTAPRLFGVSVDRATAAMTDDAATPGVFVPLPR